MSVETHRNVFLYTIVGPSRIYSCWDAKWFLTLQTGRMPIFKFSFFRYRQILWHSDVKQRCVVVVFWCLCYMKWKWYSFVFLYTWISVVKNNKKTCHNKQVDSNLKLILPRRSHDLWFTHDKAKAKQILELEK